MAEYIEREALLEKLAERDLCLCVSESDIKNMPAADVASVVHGRWSWDTGDIWTCSVCSTRNHIKEVMGRPDFNYCPNCGAKMDKEATDGLYTP